MRFLIFGDIYGKLGRHMLAHHLPELRAKYEPDAVIVNNENISHGKGPRMKQIQWLESLGVDIFTGGNHTLESRDHIREYLDAPGSRQLRPDNLVGDNIPGGGHRIFTIAGKKILVINLIGTTFMKDDAANPFQAVDTILAAYAHEDLEAILVDFHKETTSDGYAMANYLDGRASLLWGTRTHVQTNDAEIWPKGLGFISDIGFAGARHSVIGVQWDMIRHRFTEGRQEGLMSPDDHGVGVLSGLFVEIVARKCVQIEAIRVCDR